MPKVSVIIPVYNVENYIDKCLNSISNQTLDDIEIIIVNDGSTDGSKKIIEQYLKNCSNFKYFEKENGGLSSARNFGLEKAQGEYIAFLDSDDYIEPTMYKEMYDMAKKENADMVECDFIWEWENSHKTAKVDKRKNYKSKLDMMKKPRVVAWNKLIKRSIIENNKIRFPEGLIYEDLEFFFKILPYIDKILYISKSFVHYVQREKSILNNKSARVEDIFQILNNIFAYYKEIRLYDKYEKELKYMARRIRFGSSMKRILKLRDLKKKMKLIDETIWFKPKFNLENKIVFGITKLGLGGAERVLLDMVNNLCNDYDITIFTIYSGGELEKEVSSKVKIISLYKSFNKIIPIYLWIFRKQIYNKYIRGKYGLEIAFLEGPITRLFSVKSKNKKVAWVHNDITQVFGNNLKSKIKRKVDKTIYKKYDLIVFVSNHNEIAFKKLYGNNFNTKVIYNYIDKNRIIEMAGNENAFQKFDYLKLLTVARLTKQKAIDRLAKIHKRLLEEGLFHKVYVIGDGEERENIQKLIHKLNIEKSFILLGSKSNPYPYIKNCDIFALLSKYEGYGMVLEEAKIFKKPIIITKTAAVEAVKDYPQAVIAENNEEDIYIKLKSLIRSFQRNICPKFKISILTATYNRGEYLKKLYNSIIQNLGKGLEPEWIIVNDGSTDNTKQIIDEFMQENKVKIRYFFQKNSGKMAAINLAAERATGDIIVDCDSDDFFTPNSFETIYQNIDLLLNNPNLYALCFLKQDTETKKASGNKFKGNYMISTMFDLYFKDDIGGEKILVFNSKIRKKFKHELEPGEKFITEARMYHKMDKEYKILCINEVVEAGEYLKEGYTKNFEKCEKENPKGYIKYYSEIFKMDITRVKVRKIFHICKHFVKALILKYFKILWKK